MADKGRHAGLAGKWRLARDLRQQGFDLAVLFQNAFEAALLTRSQGIRRRYGYADGRERLHYRSRWRRTIAVRQSIRSSITGTCPPLGITGHQASQNCSSRPTRSGR